MNNSLHNIHFIRYTIRQYKIVIMKFDSHLLTLHELQLTLRKLLPSEVTMLLLLRAVMKFPSIWVSCIGEIHPPGMAEVPLPPLPPSPSPSLITQETPCIPIVKVAAFRPSNPEPNEFALIVK